MKLRNRFPSSRLPEGWFPMGWSHELAKGEVKSLHYFDRELVMWRGATGEVAVQDAFCLHLGAHRGVLGEVHGDDLMCPWHGWEWGQDGRNTLIPYSAEKCKKSLKIRTYPVREWCGMVVAWYSHDPDKAPTWEPPEVPEYGRTDFYDTHPFSDKVHRVKAHPQMPMENAVDPAHISYVHGAGEIPVQDKWFADQHWFQSNVFVTYGHGKESTRFTPDGPKRINVEMNCYGVGLSLIRWLEPIPTIQPTAFTVVDGEYMDYYFCQSSKRPAESTNSTPEGLAMEFMKVQWKVVEQDFPFWENMTWLEQPHFAAEESKAYTAMRRWATQFYPDENQTTSLEPAQAELAR